jgi:hypothetical protein
VATINQPNAPTGTPEEVQSVYAVDLATVHVAMYDAAVAIEGHYRPLYVTPSSATTGASMDVAIAAAAYGVLKGLFPTRAASYQAAYEAQLASVPDDMARQRGIDVGAEVAAGVLAARANDGRATPLSDDIHVMAGLINRWREHVIDGEPLAVGVIPIGDAALCTNPLHGRGCSTGYWGAHLLTDAVQRHGDDVRAIGLDYDEALRREILPWYRATVTQDAEARRVAAALLAGEDPDGDVTDPRTQMRAVFRDGLLPALQIDAIVLRAFVRNLNMLSPPDALVGDPDVGARVFAAWEDRDNRPPAPPMGPATRSEFLQPA